MLRQPISSSNIASAGWEADEAKPDEGVLEVEFRSGRTYQYEQVPRAVFEQLKGASSPGSFLQREIVGRFEEHRVK